jgi:hypothetical protein
VPKSKRLDAKLADLRREMAGLINDRDSERAHRNADEVLVEAARACGVPEDLLELYGEIDKWYA